MRQLVFFLSSKKRQNPRQNIPLFPSRTSFVGRFTTPQAKKSHAASAGLTFLRVQAEKKQTKNAKRRRMVAFVVCFQHFLIVIDRRRQSKGGGGARGELSPANPGQPVADMTLCYSTSSKDYYILNAV